MDVVSDIECEMADITLCCHVCDVVYSVCDVMNGSGCNVVTTMV